MPYIRKGGLAKYLEWPHSLWLAATIFVCAAAPTDAYIYAPAGTGYGS
jgi:hypothetical protein